MTPSPENSAISSEPSAGPGAQEIRQGRYAVVGLLGSGSQGETLEAVDKQAGLLVAIKRFMIRGAKSWKDVELAEREATVLAALSHPSLPRYIEHFEEGGALYLVMEKIEGETLASRRKRGAPLSQEQILRFLRETAASLRYLHGHAPPIVHRDIKPGNVILRPDGSYCLVDFGSVRDRLKPEGGSTVVGTFGFMAPEQFQGRAAPCSDVYAVGATALSLLTASEPEDLPHKGLGIDVEAALRGQVDRRLIAVLKVMLEPDPDRRASSIEAAMLQHGLGPAAQVGGKASPAQATKQARKARLEAEGWGRDSNESSWSRQSRVERHHEREARRRAEREVKKAMKASRRAERRARQHEHHGWHRPGRPVLPGMFLAAFILIAFQVAKLATFALFQVLLPILFTLLTVVAGRAMYQRGRRMIEIGQAGQSGLDRAAQHIRYQFLGGAEPPELAEQRANKRVRIADEPDIEPEPEATAQSIEARIEAELEAAAEALEARLEGRDPSQRRRR
ncbi:MAG TPA: serine/threonine-protein kinase [Polyangiaceae bacterium]|nr:serine/threonine-protein kinase [Polyangiaceae bacterium]